LSVDARTCVHSDLTPKTTNLKTKLKTKVLQLIDSFDQGGSERQAVQLTRLLHESAAYEVHIATLHEGGVLRQDVLRLGITDIPHYPLNSFYDRNAARQVRRFAHYLREREIELVHTHDFYTNIFGMAAATLARIPVRIASRRETLGTRTPAQKFVERRAYNAAHAIVANAEAVRADLIREGVSRRKINVVYNGLDMERLRACALSRDEALARFNLPRDAKHRFVTLVANMRLPVKDQATFLRAARRVREAVPEAAFVLAGEGELLESTRALAAELGLEGDAFFIGRCLDVPALLSISEVCVLSSKAEGFSNAILEYMAAARPLVTTDVGGVREAVVDGETGYIVGVGDDERMAERIVALLRDARRAREMGERGRRVVEEKFSCAAQLERTEKLYERLLMRAVAPFERVTDAA
jgi:glycosyltransferase involved in cell wall biosynthesis